jgi:hypothetical protein
LKVDLVPAYNLKPLYLRLTAHNGSVIAEKCIEGVDRIKAGRIMHDFIVLECDHLPLGAQVCGVELQQGTESVFENISLHVSDGTVRHLYSKVDEFLVAMRRESLELDVYLPHDPREAESMNHLSDIVFVHYLYQWLLGRNADQEGIQTYRGLLQNGVSREKVILAMLKSKESRNYRNYAFVGASGMDSYPFSDAHVNLRREIKAYIPV